MTPREQICSFCRELNSLGYMPGDSGGMALYVEHSEQNKSIFITPQLGSRANLRASDLFEIKFLYSSKTLVPPGGQVGEMSYYSPLYMDIFNALSNSRCVIEAHPEWLTLAGIFSLKEWQERGSNFPDEFKLTNWNLINRLTDEKELLIPIVEPDVESLRQKLADYPKACAIIIRNHGVLVWGRNPTEARSKLEILEHLCKVQIQSKVW